MKLSPKTVFYLRVVCSVLLVLAALAGAQISILLLIIVLPIPKKWRIILLIAVGLLAIAWLSYVLFTPQIAQSSRGNDMKNVAQTVGFSYQERQSWNTSEFNTTGGSEVYPAYMSPMPLSEYGACAETTNVMRGTHQGVTTLIFDCSDYDFRYSLDPNSSRPTEDELDRFTSVGFSLQDVSMPVFAIVNDSMKDERRLIEVNSMNTPYAVERKRPSTYNHFPLNADFNYIRPKPYDYAPDKAELESALIFSPEILALLKKEDWWYIESNGTSLHLHKRSGNHGVQVEPQNVQKLLDDAFAVFELLKKHPPALKT